MATTSAWPPPPALHALYAPDAPEPPPAPPPPPTASFTAFGVTHAVHAAAPGLEAAPQGTLDASQPLAPQLQRLNRELYVAYTELLRRARSEPRRLAIGR